MTPGTRGDGLRLQQSAVDVVSLRPVGTVPGVVLLAASARNGTGIGQVIAAPGGTLAWQAPGSLTAGVPVAITGDGAYLLEDGDDPSKWLRVQVYTAYLPGSASGLVNLADLYASGLGPADVDAADALAGSTVTTEFTLLNVTPNILQSVLLWIDPTSDTQISVSSDGTNFYQPVSSGDTHVLAWASIAVGASVNVWVKRVIGPNTASAAAVLNFLQWQWQSLN